MKKSELKTLVKEVLSEADTKADTSKELKQLIDLHHDIMNKVMRAYKMDGWELPTTKRKKLDKYINDYAIMIRKES